MTEPPQPPEPPEPSYGYPPRPPNAEPPPPAPPAAPGGYGAAYGYPQQPPAWSPEPYPQQYGQQPGYPPPSYPAPYPNPSADQRPYGDPAPYPYPSADQQPYGNQQPYSAPGPYPAEYQQPYPQHNAQNYYPQNTYPPSYQQGYGAPGGYGQPLYPAGPPAYPQSEQGQPVQPPPYAAAPEPADGPAAQPGTPQGPAYEAPPAGPYPPASFPAQPPPAGPAATPAPPSGGGRPGGRRLYAMIAGIVALIVVIGGGIWLLTSHGSGRPGGSPTEAAPDPHAQHGALRWTVPAPRTPAGAIVSPTPGMWFAGDEIVKQSIDDVTGYNIATGHADWKVAVPAGHTCGASATSAGGKVAVQYGVNCENVMGIDLSHGKLLWHHAVAGGSANTAQDAITYSNADLAVSGNTLAIAWDDNSAAFNLTTGTSQWHSSAGGKCQDQGFAGGPRLVEVYKCGQADNAPYHVRLIDPATGKAQWTWDAPADTSVTNVISVDPVVVGIGAGSDLITDVWDIDGGRSQGRVSLGKNSQGLGNYAISCPATLLTPCQDVAVSGDTLYLATRPHSSGRQDGGLTNEIAAFNLANGNPLWLSHSGAAPMDVVTTDADAVIAYQESGYDTPGRIIRANTDNGTLSTETAFSAATQRREHDAYGPGVSGLDELWQSGTLAISLNEVDSSGEFPTLMAVLR